MIGRCVRPAGLGLAAAALATGCGGAPATPEAEVRATLAAAEAAVADHDLPVLKEMVAPDYADAAGRDEAALESLLTLHFLQNARIHLLVRIRQLEFGPADRARVEALVATAGRPIPHLQALAEIRADLLWVDLDLVRREGRWAVIRARWERARLEDLL